MKRSLIVASGCILVWVGSSLLQQSSSARSSMPIITASADKQSSVASSGDFHGIHYEILGSSSNNRVEQDNNSVKITSGGNVFEIRNNRVYLNGQDRGAVRSGDAVVLDENGNLSIKRSPSSTRIKPSPQRVLPSRSQGCPGCDFQGKNLQGQNFQGVNLTGADFQDANLRGANLQGANLTGADFQDANLRGANLQGANLTGADFQDADLRGAKLQGANQTGARFDGAKF